MLALAEESASAFQSGFLENRVAVLWEQRSAGGVWSGYSANYMRVYARSVEDLTGVLGYAKLTRIYRDGLWAEITL